MDDTWTLLCASAALLLRLGLALYLGGAVRAKNAAGMAARVVADLCVVTLSFWAVGVAVLHAAPGFLDVDWSLLFGGGPHSRGTSITAVRVLVVILISSGIVVGAISERSRLFAGLAASALLGGLLVPMAARWVWRGWLFDRGYHDFAGASVVHLTGAMCALAGAVFVGPRMGKYNRDGSASVIPGHNVPLACAGVMVMVVGWLPYVFSFAGDASGHELGSIAINVLVAGAAAGLASLLYGQFRYRKVDVYLCFSGFLGGLVSISASADAVSSRFAVLIGLVAGVLIPWITLHLDLVWRIDDPSAAIATHGVGGVWGVVAAGAFVSVPTYAQKFKFLGTQALGLAVIAGLALLASAATFYIVKQVAGLRSKEADEFDGLDLAEHDIGAYPDFQQTTIKSYHLREA